MEVLTGEFVFQVLADVVAVVAVAVTNSEEVQAQLVEHVGDQDVRVLVALVWVLGLVADGGGVGKLGDAVESLA